MLQFLAGIIEEQKDKRYSEVHGFMEELKHVPKAARGLILSVILVSMYKICD